MGAGGLRKFKTSKDLLEEQLTGPFGTIIKELTGLELHVLWHQPFDGQKSGGALKLCPEARNTASADGSIPPICEACLDGKWRSRVTETAGHHRFTGVCGLTTFRVGVETGGNTSPLTLALQALVRNGDGRPRRGVRAAKFEQGIALLRLLKRDLEMALRAATAEIALERLHRRLPVLRKEAKLVRALQRESDATIFIGGRGGSHAQRIAQRMVAYVHDHFHRPMSLAQMAAAMKMNAAYLSDLFSRQLGMTFHHYLTEVRMAKARQLLLNPHRRISEVAGAVGYASADQFRHAFKAHAGVPPSQWR